MRYRSEIDGLRSIAVVPVILFHAGFELFSGGFVGVDIFFVISGYLITVILIEDLENKGFEKEPDTVLVMMEGPDGVEIKQVLKSEALKKNLKIQK